MVSNFYLKKKTKPNLHHIFTTFDSFDVIKMRDHPSLFIWVFFPTSNLISLISMTSQESKVVQNGAQSNAASKKIFQNYSLFKNLNCVCKKNCLLNFKTEMSKRKGAKPSTFNVNIKIRGILRRG